MRNELEYLARIEAYVLGTLDDRAVFEQKMLADPELQQDVSAVTELVNTLKVQALRVDVNRGYRRYRLQKIYTYTGIVLGVLLLCGVLLYIMVYTGPQTAGAKDTSTRQTQPLPPVGNAPADSGHTEPREENVPFTYAYTPETTGAMDSAQTPGAAPTTPPDSLLPLMGYALSADRDEVIETPQGIIVSIPKNSWTLPDGQTVTGQYMLELREALTPLDIMKAGLSTWAGKDLLETGGMFYLNARQGQSELQVMNGSGITVSVPKLQHRNDMLLFDGQRRADGSLDWVNPQAPQTGLLCVPMDQLDFYPPDFETEVRRLARPDADKAFLDSVYLSFGINPKVETELPRTDKKIREGQTFKRFLHIFGYWKKNKPANRQTPIDGVPRDTFAVDTLPAPAVPTQNMEMAFGALRGIPPQSVLAFRRQAFNGTLLATRAFESRMRYIHATCNAQVLACYTQHLDWPLYRCDSLALTLVPKNLRQTFENFVAEQLGRPEDAKTITPALYAYMAQKQAALEETLRATSLAWYAQQQQRQQQMAQEDAQRAGDEQAREAKNRQTEFVDSYREALRQSGRSFTPPTSVTAAATNTGPQPSWTPVPATPDAARNYNRFRVQSTGWKNVDTYVREALESRSTGTFTDKVTGNRVTLSFSTVAFTVTGDYPLLEAYLIPDGKLSFIRIKKTGNAFSESVNDLYNYRLVLVGYTQNQWWSHTQERAKENLPGSLSLVPTTESAIQQFVAAGSNTSAEGELRSELQYLQRKAANAGQQQLMLEKEALRRNLEPAVFPCAGDGITVP